ncbi:MAG: ankyrin repeat domain-containing protein [Acidimicrobiales bacterium]
MAYTTILEAIEHGDLHSVLSTLDAGFDPNTPVGDDGDLALCWAGAYGRLEIVAALLDAGADIDAAPAHGMGGPALSDALYENQIDTARALADAGASVGYESAAALGMIDQVRRHEENHGERWGAFLSACKTGQLEVVKYLVPRGIDVAIYPPGDEWGGIGASGLHWAAAGGHIELVCWLVDAGTPIDIVDDTFDNTPLGWVLLDDDERTAAALIELGADPDATKS